MICISDTYLGSSIDSNILLINRYNLIRADHTDNMKKDGVSLYFKEMLKLRQINSFFPLMFAM